MNTSLPPIKSALCFICIVCANISLAVDNEKSDLTFIEDARKYIQSVEGNGIAIVIADGSKDEITGEQIAEKLVKIVEGRAKITPRVFIGSLKNVEYSGVSFMTWDFHSKPVDIVTAKELADGTGLIYLKGRADKLAAEIAQLKEKRSKVKTKLDDTQQDIKEIDRILGD